jgi:hypothetical protein
VRYRLARGIRQVLIKWKGESAASSTWEDVDTFLVKHPTFQLEDELNLDGGGDVRRARERVEREPGRDALGE